MGDKTTGYDAECAPPAAWLGLPRAQAVEQIESFHHQLEGHPPMRSHRVHCMLHLTVERQLLLQEPPEIGVALERLQKEGLVRHEAIHALGYAFARTMKRCQEELAPYSHERFAQELASFGTAQWLEPVTRWASRAESAARNSTPKED